MTTLSFDMESTMKPSTMSTNTPDTLLPDTSRSTTMDSASILSPWAYCPTFTATESLGAHQNSDDNLLQSYDFNSWARTPSWQAMMDAWIPPPLASSLDHQVKQESEDELERQKHALSLPSVSLPPTPPNQSPHSTFSFDFLATLLPPPPTREISPPQSTNNNDNSNNNIINNNSDQQQQSPLFSSPSPPYTSLPTPSLTNSTSTISSTDGSSLNHTYLQQPKYRRRASENHQRPRAHRPYRRRASSNPSVASVVSLSAHEPVSSIIDGIEHITFLYSHDRLVKEYTLRTDVETVDINIIPMVFKAQNTIYPRANVERNKYDGNRWDYETSCNILGWKLCWLNQNQLCGRRGLIQRAVDSYRNRHAEMRSRRVTRQEKVANGTLRKRKSKKLSVSTVI